MADLKRRIVAEFSAKNKAKGVMAGFRRGLDVTGRAMKRMAKVGAVATVAAAAGLAYMVKRQMEAIDVIAKLSDQLGIATEDLVGLQHAAAISGVSTEELNKSLEMFVRRLGEMTTGGGEAQRGLKMLGLTLEELIRLSPAEAMGIAADKLNQLETQAEKNVAAYFLFGRAGAKLVNMFAVGSEGLREFQREAEKLGLTFSRFDAAQVEAANDALTRARSTMTGLFRQATIELAPYIEALADKFVDVATSGEGMGAKVVNIFEKLTLAALKFGEFINVIPSYWKGTEAAARETLATLYDIMSAATNLDILFKKLKLPKWEYTYEESAEQQRKLAAGLYEEAGATLAEAMEQQTAVENFFEKLRKKAADRRKELEKPKGTLAPDIHSMKMFEEQRKIIADINAQLQFEHELMKGTVAGPLANAVEAWEKMLQAEQAYGREFERTMEAAGEEWEEVARKREDEMERMADKVREYNWTFTNIIASGLESTMRDYENWKEHLLNIFEELYWAALRLAFIEPAAQAAAGWMQKGFSWLMGGIAGGFGGGGAGTPAPGVTPSAYAYYTSAQHGGLFNSPTLATIAETGPELVTPLSQLKNTFGGGDIDVHIHNEGSEKLEISNVESYLISDRRIIDVTTKAMQTDVRYRRNIARVR